MKIRGLRGDDLIRIDEIYRRHHENNFALPSGSNSVTRAVIENNGKVVGFGVVKVLAEAIMILDLDESKRDRLEALRLLMTEAIRGCEEVGIEQLHVFVKDSMLQRHLEKHYDFKRVSDAAMVRRI